MFTSVNRALRYSSLVTPLFPGPPQRPSLAGRSLVRPLLGSATRQPGLSRAVPLVGASGRSRARVSTWWRRRCGGGVEVLLPVADQSGVGHGWPSLVWPIARAAALRLGCTAVRPSWGSASGGRPGGGRGRARKAGTGRLGLLRNAWIGAVWTRPGLAGPYAMPGATVCENPGKTRVSASSSGCKVSMWTYSRMDTTPREIWHGWHGCRLRK